MKDKNNKILIIIIAILSIAVIFFGIYAIIRMNNTKNKGNDYYAYKDVEIRIDASLATQPLTDAYIKNLDNYKLVKDYTNTDPAYTKLINKEADLIVVTEPSKEELERAQNAGVELVVTPVVNEGFVFYSHKDNDVNNLTLEQIQKIYTGEITNWKEVGGSDREIIAYQRPVNSGSQTGILSLVMKGLKMKEPTTTEMVETMAGIIDVVSNYENSKDAIGYSYYYYATTMYGNDNLKFFSVNGVKPNHDTIKNKTYPLVTAYYIVTLKDNNNKAVESLKNTLLSARGQNIAKEAGYVEVN